LFLGIKAMKSILYMIDKKKGQVYVGTFENL